MRRALALLMVWVGAAAPAQASPESCQTAILDGAARYAQATAKAVAACRQHHVTDCAADARTAAKIARAGARLQQAIGQRCCGVDRVCGTGDDEALGAIGWGAGFCPHLDSGDCQWLLGGLPGIPPLPAFLYTRGGDN